MVANILDSKIVVCKFKLQLHYYIHLNFFIPAAMS